MNTLAPLPSSPSPDWAALVHDIRAALETTRGAHAESKARRYAKRSLLPAADPETWRAQLAELLERGLEDVAIGYWRVSTEEQQEGQGPEVQQQLIVAHMGVKGSPRREVDMWVWDAETGTTGDRAGYQFLLEAASHWQVTQVVCQKLDRFSREGGQGEVDIKALKRRGTAVVSVTETIGDGPMGDLVQLLFLGIAAYEAAIIKQRTSGGRTSKILKEGTWYGGILPYGYRTRGKGYLEICEHEAKLVRLVFDLWEKGYNLGAISEALNRWGVPARIGRRWWNQSVRNILLHEPQYRAEAHWGTIAVPTSPIPHPPLLEHRSDPADRTYALDVHRRTRFMRSVKVPDDVYGAPVRIKVTVWSRHYSKGQGDAMATCYALYDRGQTCFRHIAADMRALGLSTIRGGPITEAVVGRWIHERDYYEPKAIAAGGEVVQKAVSDGDQGLGGLRAARKRALELRSTVVRTTKSSKKEVLMSFDRIASALNEEGFRTARGSKWNVFQAEDLVKGQGMYARLVEHAG